MTAYVYRCDRDCGADTEQSYPMGEAPDFIECPDSACRGRARRIITAAAVHIPGGSKAGYVKR